MTASFKGNKRYQTQLKLRVANELLLVFIAYISVIFLINEMHDHIHPSRQTTYIYLQLKTILSDMTMSYDFQFDRFLK